MQANRKISSAWLEQHEKCGTVVFPTTRRLCSTPVISRIALPSLFLPTSLTPYPDKIYMITKDNDTITQLPCCCFLPQSSLRMSADMPLLVSTATITGSYFVDDPNVPLTITFPNGTVIKSDEADQQTRGSLTFTVPQCDTEGPITVTSIYGRDKVCILLQKDSRRTAVSISMERPDSATTDGMHVQSLPTPPLSLAISFSSEMPHDHVCRRRLE